MATLSPEIKGRAHATTPTDASPAAYSQSIFHTNVEMKDRDASTGKPVLGAGSQQISSSSTVSPSEPPITSTEPASTMASDRKENPIPGPSSQPTISVEPSSTTYTVPVAKGSEAGPSSSNQPVITRSDTAGIGPAVDSLPTATMGESGRQLVITLLLTSGARHLYKIDGKYLAKRNVTVPGVTEKGKEDPLSISVYTLKELILREWREEWEAKPSSPSSIRLIFFGKLLDDKTPLKECKFNSESGNVVHMTVRPQDIVDEEDATKIKAMARERDGGESTAGCRCVVQ